MKKLSANFVRCLAFLLALCCFAPVSFAATGEARDCALSIGFFPGVPAASPAPQPTTMPDGLCLCPGGMPFGIRVKTQGVMIVRLGDVISGGKSVSPAREAGVRVGDVLLALDGKAIADAEEATRRIAASNGKALTLSVLRGEEELSLTVTPRKADADGRYQCGLLIRDAASGIGTVTFFDSESGLFGGLGHGVCDSDTGKLIPLSRGIVQDVRICGVQRGESGKPGELQGGFTGRRLGSVVTNGECGVFGVLNELPKGKYAPVPVARAKEVEAGKATLLCTLGEDGIGEYEVEISNLDRGARPTKSFTVHVTDPRLLARTGGIVQGMSGSPLLQNGKLIGAVTHVLVEDPTTGYGIFLENMYTHMQMRQVA